jgi:hypothetical protein
LFCFPFQVSTLDLFKKILADQKSFPRDQPYKDLINLITFILRQFFKALDEEPFLAIEVGRYLSVATRFIELTGFGRRFIRRTGAIGSSSPVGSRRRRARKKRLR